MALIGVNGSGKTTLLRSLLGLQRHEGKLEVTGGGTPDLGCYETGVDLLFADGFESGDVSAWSVALPARPRSPRGRASR